MTDDGPVRVTVAVCTYRRASLADALLSLRDLDIDRTTISDIEVVVVDNDPDGSAAEIVAAAELPWPTRYLKEGRPGVSAARNAAVRAAEGDVIAFLDDDETASPSWLRALDAARRSFDADGVIGVVLPEYDPDVPRWARSDRFFAYRRHPTGTAVHHGGVGNCLLSMDALAHVDPPFDDALGLSGAEDTLLLLELTRSGRRLVFADDAVIHERVPAARARYGYLISRAFRSTSTGVIVERSLGPPAGYRSRTAGRAVVELGAGAAGFVLTVVTGRAQQVRFLRVMARGAGRLAGLAGFTYDEYGRGRRRLRRVRLRRRPL